MRRNSGQGPSSRKSSTLLRPPLQVSPCRGGRFLRLYQVRLERFDEREFAPGAFEAYSLAVAPDLFARLPESVRDKGWFNIRLAYDNQDSQTGLAELGVTSGDLAPTLYQVEKNPDTEDAPPYEVIAMRAETLANGYQYSEPELFADAPTLLVRM